MILDLFAGPGGWSEGLRSLGLSDVGIEWDASACATRHAAGHLTVRADVSSYPTGPFVGKVDGLIASPPCQDFSVAGLRKGIAGDKGKHVLEVPRWVNALRPTWVACEQVPPVVDIWKLFARWFEEWGYSTWVGILNAADYGVPQTRERAFLLAHRDEVALPPEATHAKGGAAEGMFTAARLPWVTMAEALGWGMTDRPIYSITHDPSGGGSGARNGIKDARAKGRWVVNVDPDGSFQQSPEFDPHERPSRTVTGHDTPRWVRERPATTLCGDQRVAPAGHHENHMKDAIKVTLAEALILQGFRPDYPVQGTKTKQFEQIGNAVPPPVAAAIVGALTGRVAQEVAA